MTSHNQVVHQYLQVTLVILSKKKTNQYEYDNG